MNYQTLLLVVLVLFLSYTTSQNIGTVNPEVQPILKYKTCTASGCVESTGSTITIDANWRWVHNTSGYDNCYPGPGWDSTICPNPTQCTSNCAVDGADYQNTYGITSDGTTLRLNFKTGANVASRVYLLESANAYKMFYLKNREFTMDIDTSAVPCGINGAVYLVSMDADGGASKYSGNKAGAKYGTGYCDAQCPRDIKFIRGEANTLQWTNGAGAYGACCAEMDIWEANSEANAYTTHTCTMEGLYRCNGTECNGNAICDKEGCDFNPYRNGNKTYYGKGMTVDTSKKLTITTQFLTTNGLDSGDLSEIRRIYMQDGRVISNSRLNIPGVTAYDSITTQMCQDTRVAFNQTNHLALTGGMKGLGNHLDKGMVLVLSLWDDHAAHMLWLDSNFPTTDDPNKPGVGRGPCPTTSGVPSEVESQYPNAYVTYGNIKVGTIGSTIPGGTATNPTTAATTGSTTGATTGATTGTTTGATTGTTTGTTTGATTGATTGTTTGATTGTTTGTTTGATSVSTFTTSDSSIVKAFIGIILCAFVIIF